jgi:hypothetical protein
VFQNVNILVFWDALSVSHKLNNFQIRSKKLRPHPHIVVLMSNMHLQFSSYLAPPPPKSRPFSYSKRLFMVEFSSFPTVTEVFLLRFQAAQFRMNWYGQKTRIIQPCYFLCSYHVFFSFHSIYCKAERSYDKSKFSLTHITFLLVSLYDLLLSLLLLLLLLITFTLLLMCTTHSGILQLTCWTNDCQPLTLNRLENHLAGALLELSRG